jgi:hypothetical protein
MSKKEHPENNISIEDIRNEIERRGGQVGGDLDNINSSSQAKSQSANQESDFASILEKSKVQIDQEISHAKVVVNALTPLGKVNVFTSANLSVIGGKPKSGKTTLVAMLIVAAYQNYGNLTGQMTKARNGIVFLDFEMGAKRTQALAKLVCRLLNVEHLPASIEFFSLRKHDITTRMIILEFIANRRPETALIFADGIRDLLYSINDEYEVAKLMMKLLNLLETTNIHLCSVLHFNKNDRNPRGTIGTELSNKCELLMSVEKKVASGETLHVVNADLSRDQEFTSFAFRRVNDTVELIEDWTPAKKKQSTAIENLPKEKHEAILAEVFHSRNEYSYADLVKAVQEATTKLKVPIGQVKCKHLITNYFDQGLFKTRKQGPTTLYRLSSGDSQ